MRGFRLLLLIPAFGVAQLAPPGVTGVLLERDTPAASGQFSVRAADNQVFRFQFDGDTGVERSGQPIDVQRLNPGEKIEVVSEAVDGSLVRSARSIRVLPVERPPRAAQPAQPAPPAGRIFSTPELTFSGVVSKFSPQRLVIHARDGDHTILIRKDTRYLADGGAVEAEALQPNMRVFVFAGKDLYERVEAYRIVWGSIFDPNR
ncbi:MAG: hypothetical protein ABSB88_15880 [Bryobacteraceae bacterium]|jgi:hypothetical protein